MLHQLTVVLKAKKGIAEVGEVKGAATGNRHHRLDGRRYDGRTLILAGVSLVDGLSGAGLLALSEATVSWWLLSMVACLLACAWALLRGRLGDGGCTTVLLVVVAASAVQTASYGSPTLRWASVYGMAGLPLITLMIARLRSAVLVGVGCLVAQVVIVVGLHPPLVELVTSIAIICGALPVYLTYTALLLQRSDLLRRRAEELAVLDQLTGLLNRRGMRERSGAVLCAAHQHGHHAAALLLDVDHFKAINDTHGHDTGDAVLADLGARLSLWTRPEDIVIRLGGEEFVVLGRYRDPGAAQAAAEGLRHLVTTIKGPLDGGYSISVGVSTVTGRRCAARRSKSLASY